MIFTTMVISKEVIQLYQRLFPTGRAWNYLQAAYGSEVNNYVDGLQDPFIDGKGSNFTSGGGQARSDNAAVVLAKLGVLDRLNTDINSLLDQKYPDNPNFTEDDVTNWERVFGIVPSQGATFEERKAVVDARYKYPNGIPERGHYKFIQDQLQLNGFDVYIHENRFNVATKTSRAGEARSGIARAGDFNQFEDSFNGIEPPAGTYEYCANFIDPADDADIYSPDAGASGFSRAGIARAGIARAYEIPEVNRQSQLRSSFFVGSESFISNVDIPANRQDEFRILLLKLKPAHSVGVLYINWI